MRDEPDTGEGRCFLKTSSDGSRGALIALACETDVVAITAPFNRLLEALCDHVIEHRSPSVEALLAAGWSQGTVQDALTKTGRELRESLRIVSARFLEADGGYVDGYIHPNHKVGVLAAVTTEAPRDEASAKLRQLGMHIAARPPSALSRNDIDAELLEWQQASYRLAVKGEPAEIVESFVSRMMEEFHARTLREQPWIMDESMSVEEAICVALGAGSVITDYARFDIAK